MERAILCFDIDGTLIADDASRYLPDSAREAVRLAKEAGHLTFINTGRVMVNVDAFIQEVGFDGYICGCGTYISYRGQTLLHQKQETDTCRKIAGMLRECGIFALFEAADANAYDADMRERYRHVTALQELLDYFQSMKKPFLTDIEAKQFHFDKLTAWFDKSADIDRCRREIQADFDYIDRGAQFCEIVPKGYSKATGIQFLMDYFNIPRERTYAFGDSTNDLPMLTYAAHSIVMGDADARVKEIAEYVTDSVYNHGLYRAMVRYGLIPDNGEW